MKRSKKVILVIILFPIFFLWILNGGTFVTISQEDWFYKGDKECLTNECLDSFSHFGVNPYEESSYIIPFILNKIEYKEPYYLRYDVDHLKEQKIKDFKLIIKSGEDIIEERNISESELQKEERNTAFYTEGIPFNSDIYNTMDVIVEYVVVTQGKEIRQKEKINYEVKVREDIGVRFWWNMMSV